LRFRNGSTFRAGVVAAVVVAVAVLGCDDNKENPYRPKGQLRQTWSADGERIAVTDATDEIAFKFRRRSRGLKVYDRRLKAAGFVRTPAEGEDEADAGESDGDADSGPRIRVRRVGETEGRPLERRTEGVWAVDDAMRLERTADGWAVLNAEGNWLGRCFRADGEWRLVTDQSDDTSWQIVAGEDFTRLKRGGETRYRVAAGAVPEAVLLALAIEDLPVLYRVAVGEWLVRRG